MKMYSELEKLTTSVQLGRKITAGLPEEVTYTIHAVDLL